MTQSLDRIDRTLTVLTWLVIVQLALSGVLLGVSACLWWVY